MLLSVAVFAQAMYGFKVENRGLNHARINSEKKKPKKNGYSGIYTLLFTEISVKWSSQGGYFFLTFNT